MSRLKLYIEGKLKFQDIMHPSKVVQRELRTRGHVNYHLNTQKYDIFCDPNFKNWNQKVESKLTAYINGEKTVKDIVHPSKYTELSQEAMKQKIKKNKIFKTRRNCPQPRQGSNINWIDLGKQLNNNKPVSKEAFLPSIYKESDSTRNVIFGDNNLSSDNRNMTMYHDFTNTVILNGNVNIFCLNVNSQEQLDRQANARKIYQNINQELEMLNTNTIMAAKEDSDTSFPFVQQFENTPGKTEHASRLALTMSNKHDGKNVDELITMMNELLPNFEKLKAQYQCLLSNCMELTMERKILLQHQEISDKMIKLLNEETKELKEKNQLRAEHSETKINQLNDKTNELKEMNRFLIEKLNEKQITLKELKKQNRMLVKKLQQSIEEKDCLKLSVDRFKMNVNAKINIIEHSFDSVFAYIEKTKRAIEDLQTKSNDLTDKHVLLNTIRRLDEQNSNLMGKVKHIPEKIKNILIHVSSTMSTLEEQNVRLLRTLQNTEIENLFDNCVLRRINK